MNTDKIIENLKKRGFEAVFAATKGEAVEKALSFMKEGSSVSWGGSVSIEDSGLLAKVKAGNFKLIDRDNAKTPEERAEIMRQGLTADNFLTSFNAVSEDGVLFNIDGNGNRVSAITFAAKSVVALVGINKIVPQESDLEKRALTVAAPLNAKRLKLSNEHDICATFVKTRICKPAGRIKIILVGEELGY
ncbi:lactate utilization protein [Treponema sp.]|uniref:lactate utilization protein n=1 Tax=Treponema sp. TaxID=166 RepID=UPI003890CD99